MAMSARAQLVTSAAVAILVLTFGLFLIHWAGIDLTGSLYSPDQGSPATSQPSTARLPVTHVFYSRGSQYHPIGNRTALGWRAAVTDRNYDFLNFGPYTPTIAPGPNVATFRLMVDDNKGANLTVLNLDVRDADSGKILGNGPIDLHEFKQPSVFQDFDVPFIAPRHARLEFRTFYYGGCDLTQERVAVHAIAPGELDAMRSAQSPPAPLIFPTALTPFHPIGHRDGNAWSVMMHDRSDFMSYGPYTRAVAPGANVATFRLMIDDVTGADQKVLNLDVNDSDSNRVLAEMPITRGQFKQASVYQDFSLPFVAPPGASLEFRTWYVGACSVKQEKVTVNAALAASRNAH